MTFGIAPHQVRQWPQKDVIDLIAYDVIEPYGSSRDNWHTAMQCALFASVYSKKGVAPPTIKDFMYIDKPKREKDSQVSFVNFLSVKARKDGNKRK